MNPRTVYGIPEGTTPIFDELYPKLAKSMASYEVACLAPQPFRLYGFKKRKRLARDATRVLAEAGFES
jgi:hypothetical protein